MKAFTAEEIEARAKELHAAECGCARGVNSAGWLEYGEIDLRFEEENGVRFDEFTRQRRAEKNRAFGNEAHA